GQEARALQSGGESELRAEARLGRYQGRGPVVDPAGYAAAQSLSTHALSRQVVPLRGGLSRWHDGGAARRAALRFRLATAVRSRRAQTDPEGLTNGLHRALRQLGEQPVEPRSDENCPLRFADVGRDDGRLLYHR